METITNLYQMKPPVDIQQYVELYRNPTSEDFWDDVYDAAEAWPKDQDGAGLIVYAYKGLRPWVKISVSKAPFGFLKKSLDNQTATLTNVLLIKGMQGFPFTEIELKTLSGKINNRLKNTNVACFTSYTTVSELNEQSTVIIDRLVDTVMETLNDWEYDTKEFTPETPEPANLTTFTEVFEAHGTKTHIAVKLDDNAEQPIVQYAAIRLTDSEGNIILTASSGRYGD